MNLLGVYAIACVIFCWAIYGASRLKRESPWFTVCIVIGGFSLLIALGLVFALLRHNL